MVKRKWPTGLLVVVLLFMVGCSSMEMQYVNSTEAYNVALEGVIIWREAGLMSDDSYRKVDKARVIIADGLDGMREAIDTGNDSNFDLYYGIVGGAVRQIIIWQKE